MSFRLPTLLILSMPALLLAFSGCTIPPACLPHAEYRCYDGNVQWFDSCGNPQTVKEYCKNGCSGSSCLPEANMRFERFWTDKSGYYSGESIYFFAKLVDNDGNTVAPEDGAVVNLYVASSPQGSSSSFISMPFNYSSKYYEYTTTPIPISGVEGVYIFYAIAESGEGRATSGNVYISIRNNQSIRCYSDSDCPPSTQSRYCSGNSSCTTGTTYSCSNPGTAYSTCVSSDGDVCMPCPYGCFNGACVHNVCTEGAPCTLAEGQQATITSRSGNHTVKIIGISSPTVAVINADGVSKSLTKNNSYVVASNSFYITDISYNASVDAINTVTFVMSSVLECNDSLQCLQQMKCEYSTCVPVGCIGEGQTGPSAGINPAYLSHLPSQCCAGLISVSYSGLYDSNCSPLQIVGAPSMACTKCGDGVCGSGETKCNCPQDCGSSQQICTAGQFCTIDEGKTVTVVTTRGNFTVANMGVSSSTAAAISVNSVYQPVAVHKIYSVGGAYVFINGIFMFSPGANQKNQIAFTLYTTAPNCTDQCNEFNIECLGGPTFRVCGYYNNVPCMQWQVYNCSNGYVCANNSCIQQVNQTCTDSDGGLNYNVRGQLTYTNNPYGVLQEPDSCADSYYLVEGVCNSQTETTQNHVRYYCNNGCYNGTCRPAPGSGIIIDGYVRNSGGYGVSGVSIGALQVTSDQTCSISPIASISGTTDNTGYYAFVFPQISSPCNYILFSPSKAGCSFTSPGAARYQYTGSNIAKTFTAICS